MGTILGKTRHLDFCIYSRHQFLSLNKVFALTQAHQEKPDTCTAKLAFLIGETVPKIIQTANYSCRLYRGVVASKYRMQERWRLHSAFPQNLSVLLKIPAIIGVLHTFQTRGN